MMFIAAIVVIALSSAVICSHDFGDGAIFARNANTNSGKNKKFFLNAIKKKER